MMESVIKGQGRGVHHFPPLVADGNAVIAVAAFLKR